MKKQGAQLAISKLLLFKLCFPNVMRKDCIASGEYCACTHILRVC